jgi:hypothetical protein
MPNFAERFEQVTIDAGFFSQSEFPRIYPGIDRRPVHLPCQERPGPYQITYQGHGKNSISHVKVLAWSLARILFYIIEQGIRIYPSAQSISGQRLRPN